jgi:six-Cys-in-45 modification radical SAM protein
MYNTHLFSINGYNIALDSASGAVHVLDNTCYNLLKRLTPPLTSDYNSFENDEEREAYADLLELYNDGMLFSEEIEIKPVLSPIVKSLCLHISHDCNLRCKYCFAETGDFSHGRKLMSFETGKAAIDFLMVKSGNIKNLEVDFFGGEPMMNFGVVKKLVAYGREVEKNYGKNIRFTLTTNGTYLNDDNIEFINEHISNVVLSADGRKSVNDTMRPMVSGKGTYDIIMPNYKKLIANRDKDYYIRGTFTRNNLDFASDVLHFADEGFDQISVEPVVLDKDDKLALREEDLPAIFNEYEKLALQMIERYKNGQEFNFFHFMVDLDAGPCLYKRFKGCGSGSEYIAITPEGDIYPCHQFVGYTEYMMGNVHTGEFKRDIQNSFSGNSIATMTECKTCWAKYFCGGGCAANNYKFHNDTTKPYKLACELEKKRVECALMMKAALSEE